MVSSSLSRRISRGSSVPQKKRPCGKRSAIPDGWSANLPLQDYGRVARYSSTRVVLFLLLVHNLATKICLDFCPACMSGPVGRCSPPENVLQVQSCTAFEEKSDYFIMAAPGSLVERCRV